MPGEFLNSEVVIAIHNRPLAFLYALNLRYEGYKVHLMPVEGDFLRALYKLVSRGIEPIGIIDVSKDRERINGTEDGIRLAEYSRSLGEKMGVEISPIIITTYNKPGNIERLREKAYKVLSQPVSVFTVMEAVKSADRAKHPEVLESLASTLARVSQTLPFRNKVSLPLREAS